MLQRTLWALALTLAGCTSALPAGGGVPTAAAPVETSPAEQGLLAPETIVDEYKVAGPIECPLDPSRPHDYLATPARKSARSPAGLDPSLPQSDFDYSTV